MSDPTVISTFAGPGGSSLGYEQAGFDVRAALDCAPGKFSNDIIPTYKQNHPETTHVTQDARETTADGRLPVNLSGGLKAKGHPVGATGGSQIAEITRLLRGDHPNSDAVDDATVGVAHNAGGTVASAVVHVLEAGQ